MPRLKRLAVATSVMRAAPPQAAEPIDIPAFQAIERPVPTAQLAYGDALAQAIDVFVPDGQGPFPVAVLIHGGCWSVRTAAREQVRHLGADLAARGIATWSIGYRRADEEGGGYPGTYQDVASAIDRLRGEAPRLGLDLSRVVLVGHSAGGHLALWAASRDRLPARSVLRVDDPFVPREVVSIAGIGDLRAFLPQVPGLCGQDVADRLVGVATQERADVYSDTSPAALPAPGARITMVSGILDRLVPPYVAHDYAQAMRGQVDVELVEVRNAGHFDLVAQGEAWREVRAYVERALERVRAR